MMHFQRTALVIWGATWALMALAPAECLGASLSKRMLTKAKLTKAPMSQDPSGLLSTKMLSRGPNHETYYERHVMPKQTIETGHGKVTTSAEMEKGHKTSRNTWGDGNVSGQSYKHHSFARTVTVRHFQNKGLSTPSHSDHLGYAAIAEKNVRAEIPSSTLLIEELDDEVKPVVETKSQERKKLMQSQSQPVVELPEDDEPKEKKQVLNQLDANNPGPSQSYHSQSEPVISELSGNHDKQKAGGYTGSEGENTVVNKPNEPKIKYSDVKIILKQRYRISDKNIKDFKEWLKKTDQNFPTLESGDVLELATLLSKYMEWADQTGTTKKIIPLGTRVDTLSDVQQISNEMSNFHLDELLEILYPKLTPTERMYRKQFAIAKGYKNEIHSVGPWTPQRVEEVFKDWERPASLEFHFFDQWDKLKRHWKAFLKWMKKAHWKK